MPDEAAENAGRTAGGPGWATMKGGMQILLAVVLGAVLFEHILVYSVPSSSANMKHYSTSIAVLAFLAVALMGIKKEARRFLGSSRFAVPVVFYFTLYCIIGTLVVQNIPAGAFMQLFGDSLAAFLAYLHFDDIFHSAGFCAVLGIGAGGLFLSLFPLRPVTFPRAGKMLAHLGILTILAGAGVGAAGGIEGQLGLYEGQSADTFLVPQPGGKGMMELPLGFSIRLDDFRVEQYEPSFRLRIYKASGIKSKLLASADPAGGDDALQRYGVKILGYWPDYEEILKAEKAGKEEIDPAGRISALGIKSAATRGKKRWLLVAMDSPAARLEIPSGRKLVLSWSEQHAKELISGGNSPKEKEHWIKVGEHEFQVRVGRTYDIPGKSLKLRVLEAFTDLIIDMQSGQASNRSADPNNPALRVALLDADGNPLTMGWLFSKFDSFHAMDSASPIGGIKYTFRQKSSSGGRGIVIVAETQEVWLTSEGQIVEKLSLKTGGESLQEKLGAQITDFFLHARPALVRRTKSDRAVNPAVEIRLEGEGESRILKAGMPLHLEGGRALLLTSREEKIKDYYSTLCVFEEGRQVLTKTIEVNDPLSYGGYRFYQSSHDPMKPGWTGLQVVADPGLWLVYAGFVINLLGIVAVFLIEPVRRRYRTKKKN